MAKYIITSIPQYRDGGPGKRKKKKTVEPASTSDNPQLREMISKSLGVDQWLSDFKTDNESKLNSLKQSMLDMYTRNIEEEKQKEREKQRDNFTGKYNKYVEATLKKGDKYKKGLLAPFQTFTKEEFENNSKLQDDYNNKSSNIYQGYHVEKKDLGNGDYKINLYPKQAILNLMWNFGVKPGEFQTHHGLDAEQLQKEFGDELKAVDQYHIGQGSEMIDKLTKQGYSAEDAKRILVQKGYNAAEGVKQFKDIADAYDIKNNADTYFVDDNLVMYKKDKTGKVYKYTNSYGNDNFSVNDPSKYKESDNPLKDTKNWIWESVDPSKVKTNKEGNITVNGRSANLYDYGFGDRPGDKNDKAILSKYTTAIGSMYKESEEAAAVGSQQETYKYYNNTLFDNVYENNPDQKLLTIPAIGSGLSDDYVTSYNNTVAEINKTTDVNKRAKLLEDFNSKTNKSIKVSKPDGKGFYDKKVNMGLFDNYGEAFNNRDVKAYKTSSGLKNQMGYAKDEAAQNILEYAYANKINPGSESLNYVGFDGSKYTGEEGDATLPFKLWSQTADAQEFVKNYKKDPNYFGKVLDVEANRSLAKQKEKMSTMPWYIKAGDQAASLLTHPGETLDSWTSGKLADPYLSQISNNPTATDIAQWEGQFGQGTSRYLSNKNTEFNNDVAGSLVSMFNPMTYFKETGIGLKNKLAGDPDQTISDIGLNAVFAATLGVPKLAASMGAKLLPGAKSVGKLANNRVYNATRNFITPSNALTAHFAKDAFLPTGEIDPNTGEEIQGWGTEAGKNILKGVTEGNGTQIKENLFPAGMALLIGAQGAGKLVGLGKDLYRGVPNSLPPGTTLMNNRYNFQRDPSVFNQQYFNANGLNSGQRLLNSNGKLTLKKEGGDLPQAKMGWPPKGLKKITRSNYNPISYPIKKIGYKIATQSASKERSKADMLQGILGKSKNNYFGQAGYFNEEYGPGKRDLNKLYFFGDETGFEPIDYDFTADAGLDAMVQEYRPLKAYLMNSNTEHGKPLSIFDFDAYTKSDKPNDLGYHDLNHLTKDLYFPIQYAPGRKPIFSPVTTTPSYLLNQAFDNPKLQMETDQLKEVVRTRLNELFEKNESDVIPFEINHSWNSQPKFKLHKNPIIPLDNVEGHMGFLKRLPNKEFELTSRDIWSFRPNAYNEKWHMNSGFKKAQTQLMDMFGKPFVLTQTNPVKFKEGGDLPKAKIGRISRSYKPTVFGKPTYKPSSTYFNKGITTGNIFSSTKKLPTNDVNIKYPIQFGDEAYKLSGEPMYHVDPLDYQGLDWKKEGIIDYLYNETREPTTRFPENEKNLNNVEGSDISIDLNKLGDFDFKPFSDGWEVRNQMMNAFDGPQWAAGKNNFFTESELINLVNQQSEWQKARNSFDDMYPEDPGMAMFNAFSGNNSREELFSNLFPNASMPNFRSKFTTPSQEALLQQHLPWQYSIKNKGMLNPNSLKNINGLGDTLPRTYQELLKNSKGANFLTTSPAKDVVMEMRGSLGLKMEDVKNATPEQFEKWRQQIVKNKNKQLLDRWNRDIEKPFKGSDAWNQITSQPGWKNKNGGIAMQLSKKDINKYVQGGYIVEEE